MRNIGKGLIGGNSTQETHKNWIEVLSVSKTFENGADLGVLAGGGTTGKPSAPVIELAFATASGLTELMESMLTGKALAGFELHGLFSGTDKVQTVQEHKFADVQLLDIDMAPDGSYIVELTAGKAGSAVNYYDSKSKLVQTTEFGFDFGTGKSLTYKDINPGSDLESAGFATGLVSQSFIRFDGIDGESTEPGYEGWSDLLDFSFGLSAAAGDFGTKQAFDLLEVEIDLDTTAPQLVERLLSGKLIDAIELDLVGPVAGKTAAYMEIDLRDARIVSSDVDAAKGDTAIHTLEIAFDQIFIERFETTSKGEIGTSHEFGWDTTTGLFIDGGNPSDAVLSDVDGAKNAVLENAAIGTTVGIDVDGSSAISAFRLSDDAGGLFAIDGNGVVTVAGNISREIVGPSVQITVEADVTSGPTISELFTISIADVDEFDVSPPKDIDDAANEVTENSAKGTPVGVIMFATDDDATLSEVSYSIALDPAAFGLDPSLFLKNAQDFFAIDPAEGVLVTLGGLDYETMGGQVLVPILAVSQDGSQAVTAVAIQILDEGGIFVAGTSAPERLNATSETDTISGDGAADTINGFAGDDLMRGGAGYDRIFAGDGNDSAYGGNGKDYAVLGRGNDFYNDATGQTGVHAADRVYGGDGNDVIQTRGGNDFADGGRNNDRLFTGYGDDTANGGGGNDSIFASNGNDVARGGDGNDVFYMGLGNDEASGGRGSDVAYLGAGDDWWYDDGQTTGHDRVYGEKGRDTIFLAGGNDTASGGADADTFILSPKPGHDVITDFELGVDQVLLSDGLMDGGSDLWKEFVDLGESELILRFGDAHSITFANLTVGDDLTGSIFLLSEVLA